MFLPILRVCLLLSLASALWITEVRADVFKLGHMRLSGDTDTGLYVLTATVPRQSLSRSGISLPEGCKLEDSRRTDSVQGVSYFYTFYCPEPPSGVIQTPWRLDGARFINELSPDPENVQSLRPGPLGIDVPLALAKPPPRDLATSASLYIYEGIVHIWFGWDHLLFVLCLCFLLSGRQLIAVITAFTLGHSLTLALSYFDLVAVPIAPVESLIAFSILLMARQVLLSKPHENTEAALQTFLIITAFGLLHGLGFASALSELGASDAEKWPALIFFNLGVEIGQIVFVGVMTVLIWALRSGGAFAQSRAAMLGGAGCVAGFWFVERLAALSAV